LNIESYLLVIIQVKPGSRITRPDVTYIITLEPSMPESRAFIPLNIAVLTVSDTRTEADDTSGGYLVQAIEETGHRVAEKMIVPDDIYRIRAVVSRWIADPAVNAVITTGGTGITGRDGTPEAVAPLLDKEIEGFGELFRAISYQQIRTSSLQSRAVAGVANSHLHLLPARLLRRLPHRLGRDHPRPAGQPPTCPAIW
jgi:molybdopterin adenylyltransferase